MFREYLLVGLLLVALASARSTNCTTTVFGTLALSWPTYRAGGESIDM